MIERFGGDPEAVLKPRPPSDFGPASPSRIRRRRDRRVGCDRRDCRASESLSRHVTSESHETHALFCIDRFYTDQIVSRDHYILSLRLFCVESLRRSIAWIPTQVINQTKTIWHSESDRLAPWPACSFFGPQHDPAVVQLRGSLFQIFLRKIYHFFPSEFL